MSPVAKKPARKAAKVLSPEEQAAMRELVRERKAQARANRTREDGERELLAAIAAMPEPDRAMATRLHAIVSACAPVLVPRIWYGMPAWAKDDKIVCFFRNAQKFKDRYATFGFNDKARLDEGVMWPTAFALTAVDAEVKKRIAALLQKALG